ncbi:MAG: tetraacyldisaccharide 4'-kinase [Rhodoferax sp.]|jgi:tetraacyldisaccharide 4'-kinase|nr:tetraacyldisaccharide 4'-kinase [Rhodoferax sp.]
MASAALQRVLVNSWSRRGALARLLLPVALLYAGALKTRKWLFRMGIRRSASVPVPVIVVGNVVAGGGGKTPLVVAIVRHLQDQGHRVGVVSRGYGRSSTACLQVTDESTAADAGDEPLLIHRLTGAHLFVAARRIDAARALLRQHPDVDVLVCDDGLQHLQLSRDIEICVFGPGGTGNGWLLPAGPLREPWPRKVDLIVADGSSPDPAAWPVRRTLAAHARRADGQQLPLRTLGNMPGAPVWAVAAIARPDAFFAMLRDAGLSLAGTTALPDHAAFDAAPWSRPDAHTLVCTEKDAMKLWLHRPDAWAVPLVLDVPPGFWSRLDTLLASHTLAKLSSPHGHTTA